MKHHRYETAYRERMEGILPVTVAQENFDKEGLLPVFIIRVQDDNGNVTERKYKLNTPIVRRVYAPGEEPVRAVSRKTVSKKAVSRKLSASGNQEPFNRRGRRARRGFLEFLSSAISAYSAVKSAVELGNALDHHPISAAVNSGNMGKASTSRAACSETGRSPAFNPR